MTSLNYLLSQIQTDYTTIRVVFETSRNRTKYTYKCADLSVKKGDYVVVLSPDGAPAIGLVAGVDKFPKLDKNAAFDYKWIVCKVDLEEYNARMNGEKAFYEAIEEAQHNKERADAIEALSELGVSEDKVRMITAVVLPPAEDSQWSKEEMAQARAEAEANGTMGGTLRDDTIEHDFTGEVDNTGREDSVASSTNEDDEIPF